MKVINPDDKSGIETALRLKEENGGSVTVVTMGLQQAQKALREALTMGCDDAVLISGREFGGSDTYATANIIAAGLKSIEYDLIIAGRQAIDGDTAQVGPQIAERLGIPQISYAEEVNVESGKIIAKRQFEDGYHMLRASLPCLITTLAETVTPRYMTFGGIFSAYEKEIRILDFEALKDNLDVEKIGLKGSPTKVFKSFTKQAKGAGGIVSRSYVR